MEKEQSHERSGFTIQEVDKYNEMFQCFDKDKSGEISRAELFPLIEALGKAPRTRTQRDQLGKIIDDIDADGSGEISFLEFLRLMRRFMDDADAAAAEKEKSCIAKSGFDERDVSRWRQIFERFANIGSGDGEIDREEAKKLLQFVGVRVELMPPPKQTEFKEHFCACDIDRSDSLDFPEFLLLMKRFLDKDFGDLSSKLKPKAKATTDGDESEPVSPVSPAGKSQASAW